MQKGFKFTNADMRLTVVLFEGTEKHNVALLEIENSRCPYVTVRNLSESTNGEYDWAWGHYFLNYNAALADYNKRKKEFSREEK